MRKISIIKKIREATSCLLILLSCDAILAQSAPAMVYVTGGTFTMGCTVEQGLDCESNESPTHSVTLPDFAVGRYEVTQTEWFTLMGTNPSYFTACGGNCPVEEVSWYDAVVYCNRLSELYGFMPCYYADEGFTLVYGKTGNAWSLPNAGTVYWRTDANGYRLPTEAEWEYAARGGALSQGYKYAGSNLVDNVAWYWDNCAVTYTPNVGGKGTHPVGDKISNELNAYDMSGNVWEWCYDWFSSTYYVESSNCTPLGPDTGLKRHLRGGDWFFDAVDTRVANRGSYTPIDRGNNVGFRLAQALNGAVLAPYNCPTLNLNIGNPCNDGNPNTNNDVVQANCSCAGTPLVNTPEMVLITGGTFLMGCTAEQEPDCNGDESPFHDVTLPSFYIGNHEVTQDEWATLMGSNPSFLSVCGSNCPVEQVSWYDAVVYCNRLSQQAGYTPCYYSDAIFNQVYGWNGTAWTLPNSGQVYWDTLANGYRLPTEAEWEYAARGGTLSSTFKYAGSNTVGDVAWYNGNSSGTTHPIKSKIANELLLFDMSGNVYKWCYDRYGFTYYNTSPTYNPKGPNTGLTRLIRGGSWTSDADRQRVAFRDNPAPSYSSSSIGFRIARTVQ